MNPTYITSSEYFRKTLAYNDKILIYGNCSIISGTYMNENKNIDIRITLIVLITWIASIIAAAWCGYYYGSKKQPEIITKTVTEYIALGVKKEDLVKNTNNNKHIIKKTIKRPDGTIEKTVEISDKSTITENKNSTEVNASKDNLSSITKIIPNGSSKYGFGLFIEPKTLDLKTPIKEQYNLGISARYRVFGPFWLESGFTFGSNRLKIGIEGEL